MMNRRFVIRCGAALAFTIVSFTANGQKSTELYTPIGQSPGLSGEFTVSGVVDSVDETARSFRINGLTASASALVTESTEIYLDRSELKETNRYGNFGDLKEGRRVEILYVDREAMGHGPAEWIKIAMAEPEN